MRHFSVRIGHRLKRVKDSVLTKGHSAQRVISGIVHSQRALLLHFGQVLLAKEGFEELITADHDGTGRGDFGDARPDTGEERPDAESLVEVDHEGECPGDGRTDRGRGEPLAELDLTVGLHYVEWDCDDRSYAARCGAAQERLGEGQFDVGVVFQEQFFEGLIIEPINA